MKAARHKLPLPLLILGVLALFSLVAFATVIVLQLVQQKMTVVPAKQGQDALSGDAPISILPVNPDGVTVLVKQAEDTESPDKALSAPIAQGASIASGFAMDIGSADSFLELSRRFAELITLNGKENFQRLEPRAILRETVSGLEARLLVGPFDSEKQAEEACAILIVPDNIKCATSTFQGDLIAREAQRE